MKLLVETVDDIKFLKEDENGNKGYYITGIFLQADVVNKNKRVYPKDILLKEVKRYKTWIRVFTTTI